MSGLERKAGELGDAFDSRTQATVKRLKSLEIRMATYESRTPEGSYASSWADEEARQQQRVLEEQISMTKTAGVLNNNANEESKNDSAVIGGLQTVGSIERAKASIENKLWEWYKPQPTDIYSKGEFWGIAFRKAPIKEGGNSAWAKADQGVHERIAEIFSAYAPRSGSEYPERQGFYHDIGEFVQTQSSHGPKLILGDFSASLHDRFDDDAGIIGQHVFQHPGQVVRADANRHPLVEMCKQLKMRLSNAFFSAQQQDLATNYNVGCPVGEPVGRRRHPQIDFILRAQKWLHDVLNVTVRRDMPLSSHHFLLQARVHAKVEKTRADTDGAKADASQLADIKTWQRFTDKLANVLEAFADGAPDRDDVNLAWRQLVDGFHNASEQDRLSADAAQAWKIMLWAHCASSSSVAVWILRSRSPGGATPSSLKSFSRWERGMKNVMVAVVIICDRYRDAFEPLLFLFYQEHFPDAPLPEVVDMSDKVGFVSLKQDFLQAPFDTLENSHQAFASKEQWQEDAPPEEEEAPPEPTPAAPPARVPQLAQCTFQAAPAPAKPAAAPAKPAAAKPRASPQAQPEATTSGPRGVFGRLLGGSSKAAKALARPAPPQQPVQGRKLPRPSGAAPPDLIWECVKHTSSFIRRPDRQILRRPFCADPANMVGLHAFKFSGVAAAEALCVRPTKRGIKEGIELVQSHAERAGEPSFQQRPKSLQVTMGLSKCPRQGLKRLDQEIEAKFYRRGMHGLARLKYLKVQQSFKKKKRSTKSRRS
ncbi:unnamed protein product [Prorocentrum cordatum]|uniref:Ribosomal eL28/Mak16 domain-containing protein n=1 Tax=Prorocentrum cordatum TaxID=2364126 RepID=A0ABN9XZQ6_9DINO|nr:unnamed protein product [Polarella glacialis]